MIHSHINNINTRILYELRKYGKKWPEMNKIQITISNQTQLTGHNLILTKITWTQNLIRKLISMVKHY